MSCNAPSQAAPYDPSCSAPTQLPPVDPTSIGSPPEEWWGRLARLDGLEEDPLLLLETKSVYSFGSGRKGESCDFLLDGIAVSSQHFCISRTREADGTYTILINDLSLNGTFLNGESLGKSKSRALFHGDIITCGEHEFIFQHRSKVEGSLAANAKFQNLYRLGQELGRGNFSVVRLGVDKMNGQEFAVKIIDKRRFAGNAKVLEALIQEVLIMKSLEHPNVVQLQEAFEIDSTSFIVMELLEGGDLLQYIGAQKHLVEPDARRLFKQMIAAVEYLHQLEIIHRDLKPENFLLTKDHKTLKLSDFGLARAAGIENFTTVCGTPAYIAPEILKGTGRYDGRVDIYSLGAILYFMLSGEIPPDGASQQSPSTMSQFSETAAALIKEAMHPDPVRRITLRSMATHPWIEDRPMPLVASTMPDTFRRPIDITAWATLRTESGTEHKLFKNTYTIGRGKDVDLRVVNDLRVSSLHCKICKREDGEAILEDHSVNGVRVNGMRIGKGGSAKLVDGDLLLLVPEIINGPAIVYTFAQPSGSGARKRPAEDNSESPNKRLAADLPTYTFTDRRVSASPRYTPLSEIGYLTSLSAPSEFPPDVALSSAPLRIGRRPDNDVLLSNIGISSVHCIITPSAANDDGRNKVWLEDLSRNGMFLNGRKLGKGVKVELVDGDEVELVRIKDDPLYGFRFHNPSRRH
ncbi:kinase-like domain-containing protein [Fimicolochytrium jonesii]|uniref:kinase-like domain-containing protein n=1 Tax=Fimicolochytrium jonesii TaxID=1396493 RepID=UPI0022FE4B4D|nr:kinase-like domain-containing protein [Fimicolochytrium jonesii]KAI8816726.1 kinase-like domain-containing protein [Fimicolochytrium jonesii]